jgi:two-component system, chemotaxis family, protein-glutamate methylesterase/glutaminase
VSVRPRRVVICEDSKTYATALKRFLEHDPDIEVAGVFGTAEELLLALDRIDPDLVTMDLEMPGMGGLRAIQQIMGDRPLPILVLSDYAGKGSERAAEAMAAGALDAMPKTGLRLGEHEDVWANALRSRVKRIASIRLNRDRPRDDDRPSPPAPSDTVLESRGARVIGIGASTGGPPALLSVLRELPADFEVPVLVVQHIASGFTRGLVSWLDSRVPLPVRIARAGGSAARGVWFAPDDAHLRLSASMRLSTDSKTRVGPHRPSLDALFGSLAARVGEGAVGVVLTGMGRDGAHGVEEICRAGGVVIAQDEETSAVFGMPAAAIESGAEVVLPLAEVGGALASVSVEAVT